MFFETFFYLSFFDIFGCGFSRSVKKSLSSDNFQGSGILGGVGGVNSSTVKHKVGQGLAQSSLVVPSTKASRKQSKANMEDNSKSFLREKLELKDQLSWNTFYHVCEEVFWSNKNWVWSYIGRMFIDTCFDQWGIHNFVEDWAFLNFF